MTNVNIGRLPSLNGLHTIDRRVALLLLLLSFYPREKQTVEVLLARQDERHRKGAKLDTDFKQARIGGYAMFLPCLRTEKAFPSICNIVVVSLVVSIDDGNERQR